MTGLLRVDTFRKEPLYLPGEEPDAAETAQRRERYWRPYHAALQAELERLLARHGRVVLWDAHSICSVLPRFFEGRLPDLNLGTADGRACAPSVQAAAVAAMAAQDTSHACRQRPLQGRLDHAPLRRAGARACTRCSSRSASAPTWTRRAPFAYRPDRAARLQPLLRQMLEPWCRRCRSRLAPIV